MFGEITFILEIFEGQDKTQTTMRGFFYTEGQILQSSNANGHVIHLLAIAISR